LITIATPQFFSVIPSSPFDVTGSSSGGSTDVVKLQLEDITSHCVVASSTTIPAANGMWQQSLFIDPCVASGDILRITATLGAGGSAFSEDLGPASFIPPVSGFHEFFSTPISAGAIPGDTRFITLAPQLHATVTQDVQFRALVTGPLGAPVQLLAVTIPAGSLTPSPAAQKFTLLDPANSVGLTMSAFVNGTIGTSGGFCLPGGGPTNCLVSADFDHLVFEFDPFSGNLGIDYVDVYAFAITPQPGPPPPPPPPPPVPGPPPNNAPCDICAELAEILASVKKKY
jgi:hypothetical protein